MSIDNNEYKRIVKGINMDDNLENIISLKLEQFDENGSGFKAFLMKKTSFIAIIGAILFCILFISGVIFSISNMYPISPKGVVERYIEALEIYDYEQADDFIEPNRILNYLIFKFDVNSNRTIYNRTKEDDNRVCSVKVEIEYSDNEVGAYLFQLGKINGRWYIIDLENITNEYY